MAIGGSQQGDEQRRLVIADENGNRGLTTRRQSEASDWKMTAVIRDSQCDDDRSLAMREVSNGSLRLTMRWL
ncbi:hypothetical protein TIFTF001_004409 [Ficus carica]|uniref:Uncharacterized protein n=1 Tax=Ficus carica TaxID=3494 RepID=A0AA88CXU4_FICCA|nr:hypothetical protein TIFTF001_004409 [Ficus carica]